MSIQVREVEGTRELTQFILFPHSLYETNNFWVPPLIRDERNTLTPDRNAAFEYCEARSWLAWRDGRVVGRIAGIINRRYIDKWKDRYACFSRFDFVDDELVSRALLGQVEDWARSKGLEGVHGPLGFTNFDHLGMLVEGFQELPTIASTYNYDYYPKHVEKLGYQKEWDYLEFQVKVPDRIPEKAERVAHVALKRNKLTLVKLASRKELLPYARQVFDVINAAYEPLAASVELTEKMINMFIRQWFSFILPEYVTILANEQGRVVGFQISMPSLSRAFQKAKGRLFPFGFIHILRALKRPNILDLCLVGVLPEYQSKGLMAIFMNELTKTAIAKKIICAETNSELETNTKVQDFWTYYDARQHKRKRVYVKLLAERAGNS